MTPSPVVVQMARDRPCSSTFFPSTILEVARAVIMNEKHESFFESMRQKRPTPAGRLTFVGLRGAEYVFQSYILPFSSHTHLSYSPNLRCDFSMCRVLT
jgi:hypothetical protein